MAKLEKTRTPGVYKRGARYVAIWRHRGQQHKSFHRTYEEAREAKAQRDAGDKRPVAKIGLGDYFDNWIESYAGRTSRGFSETSREEYRRVMSAHVLKKWKTWKLADVEPVDVRDLLGVLRRNGKSTTEIRKVRSTLSVMFATAVEDGLLRSNPAQGVRIPAKLEDSGEVDDPGARALTREELSLMLAALPDRWRLFYELLVHTGLRISEAVGLTWEHVDLGETPRLYIREQVYRGKRRKLKSGAARRDIPLSPAMAARLLAHRRDTYGGAKAPVFLSPTGVALSPPNLARDVLHPAREAAGLPWVHHHTFRHTCASLLFDAGRNIKQVADWLGHADPAFCLRTYISLMDAGVGDADFLDEVVTVGVGNKRATAGPATAVNADPVASA
jgi:integrase